MEGLELLLLSLLLLTSFGLFQLLTRRFHSVYRRHSETFSGCQMTGRASAESLLQTVGLDTIPVVDGAIQDQYDWRRGRVLLRTETAVSSSVAAVAVASHEVGHAQQFADGYWAARLVPVAHWGSCSAVAISLGLFFVDFTVGTGGWMMSALIVACIAVILFRLPIVFGLEADATRRALLFLNRLNGIDALEQVQIQKVLNAGYWTHVSLVGQQLACVVFALALLGTYKSLDLLGGPSLLEVMPNEVVVASTVNPTASRVGHAPIPVTDVSPTIDDAWPFFFLTFSMDLFYLVILGGTIYWFFRRMRNQPRNGLAADLNNTGLKHFHANRFEEALASIDNAIAMDPRLPMAHYNRAVVLSSLGRFDEALQSVNRFTAIPSSTISGMLSQSDFWYFRGVLYVSKEMWTEAEHDFTEALKRPSANRGVILRDRCLAHLRLGHLAEAVEDGTAAVQQLPDDAVAKNNLGVALAESGRYSEALELFQKATKLLPDFPNPYRHWAWLLVTCPDRSLRDGLKGVALATRALELSKWTNTEWFDVLAAAHAETENFIDAIQWQERHLQSLSQSTPAYVESSARLDQYRRGLPVRV